MTTANHYHSYIYIEETEIWEEVEIDDKMDLKACKHLNGPVTSIAHPQVADGGDGLQICKVAANILNKLSRTADKWWSSSLGFGRGANNSSPQKILL
jgi:hypothetical protein